MATPPVPNSSFEVAEINLKTLDSFVNLTEGSAVNREGVLLTPLPVMQQTFNSLGYIDKGTFAAGATLSSSNEILSDGSNYWRWSGAFPKAVASGSSPTPSGVGAWLLVGDSVLRSDLALFGSTALIGGVQAKYIFRGRIPAEYFGVVMDGITDNSAALASARDFSNTYGATICFGAGVCLMSSKLSVDNKFCRFDGIDKTKSALKLISTNNNHVIETYNNAVFHISNMTVDQGWSSAKTAGQALRNSGSQEFTITNCRLTNARTYGFGIVTGTTKGVRLQNVDIDNVGQAGLILLDPSSSSDTVHIDNVRVSSFGLVSLAAALELSGNFSATKITVLMGGNNYGVSLLKPASGKSAHGSISGIRIRSDGTATTSSRGFVLASDSNNFTVDNVTMDSVGVPILQSSTSVGGQISNVTIIDALQDISLAGTGLTINGLSVSTNASAPRVIDFEPTASDIQISDFRLIDNSATSEAVRIQVGCQNIALLNGRVYGGTVTNSGTNTVQSSVRIL